MRRSIPLLSVAVAYASLLLLAHAGCGPSQPPGNGPAGAAPVKMIQSFNANIERTLESPPAPLNAARNETASTVIQLAHLPKPAENSVLTLRLAPLVQSESAQIDLGPHRNRYADCEDGDQQREEKRPAHHNSMMNLRNASTPA